MPGMNSFPKSTILLVADRRADARSEHGVPVRRYRLARLGFDSRPSVSPARRKTL
jgi:hypothetical protein